MKKLLVSACLIGQNCKYNGGNNFSSKLDAYIKEHDYEVIPVCPEVLGGLPTPRVPSEIVNGIVTNKNGISVHTEFCQGAKKALEIADRAYVLETGRIVTSGPADALMNDDSIKKAYLGE